MPTTITHGLLPVSANLRNWLWRVALVIFVVGSLGARLLFLRTTPASVNHDEIYYITEAKAVALSGHDLKGTWSPWQLKPASTLYAELPGTVMSLAARFVNDPFLAARITHIIFGTIFPFLLAAVIYGLFKEKRLAIIGCILAMCNPWLFQFSRLSFDALLSLTFYFAAAALLLNTKGKWKLSSLLFWVLGFFQYQGLKIVFLPMLGLLLLYEYVKSYEGQSILPARWQIPSKSQLTAWLKKSWPLLVIGMAAGVLFVWYIKQLPSQTAGSRTQDIVFFNQDNLSKLVNNDRRLTILGPGQSLFTNKFSVLIREIFVKYSQAFNPLFLFVQGESIRNPFSVWSAGMFHLVDAAFLIIGGVVVWQKKKWRAAAWLLLGLILVAPLPSAINTIDSWIMFRASLLVPLFIIVISIGVDWLWQQKLAGLNLPVWKIAIVVIYAVTIASFSYQYFFRYPIYSTKGQGFAERVMANYIARISQDHKVLVLSSESEFVFETYLFYNNLITQKNLPALRQAFQTRRYELGNVRFNTDCVDLSTLTPDTVIIDEAIGTVCPDEAKQKAPFKPVITAIPSLLDSGAIFKLYNDTFCSYYTLGSFSRVQTRSLLDVEKLDDRTFCESHLIYP